MGAVNRVPVAFEDPCDHGTRQDRIVGALEGHPQDVVDAAHASLRDVLIGYLSPDGVRMRASSWLVRARLT